MKGHFFVFGSNQMVYNVAVKEMFQNKEISNKERDSKINVQAHLKAIVKNSSPLPTVGQQITDRLPTDYQQGTDSQ